MDNAFLRTEMLIGTEALSKLMKSKVAVFGIGGVGSFTVEALARCGVGNIDIFDGDIVDITNINRQLIATYNTIGLNKVDVMKERILSINPNANMNAYKCHFDASNEQNYDFNRYDYIVDAIDTVTSKILIIDKAKKSNVKVISSMGTGNKINPTKLEITDIYSTKNCPLARVMRRELKSRNIKSLKVVYSTETPIYKPKDRVNASVSFVPSVAGLLIASEVVRDLTAEYINNKII